MLLAYIDEIGESGAYVAKDHPKYKTSPVFGYAGFVIPERAVRRFGQVFTQEKRTVFRAELDAAQNAGQWERKGSDIFTHDAWNNYRPQIRMFRGLVDQLDKLGGKIFYYAEQKEPGTPAQTRETGEQREITAMQQTVNRLCSFGDFNDENLLIMADKVNEKQREARVARIYAHIFSRSKEFPEMARAVEPPMHIDSKLSANIQFADWVAAAVGRAIDYQLEETSRYSWIPEALGDHMRGRITHDSKLRLWQSSMLDFYHFDIFKRDRPYVDKLSSGTLSPENLELLRKVKHASAKR